MKFDERFCPNCGAKLEQGSGNYNYDNGHTDYICEFCGWEGNETKVYDTEKYIHDVLASKLNHVICEERDVESIIEDHMEVIIKDIKETAGEDFNDSDIHLALDRFLKAKLNII